MSNTLQVKGTDYSTPDGTCVRDYIDVTDLVDAHVKALQKAEPRKVGIYNVGTGKGRTFLREMELPILIETFLRPLQAICFHKRLVVLTFPWGLCFQVDQ